MCVFSKPDIPQSAAAPIIAAPDNGEANRQADLESRLRRRRAGAAADILTGASGIPATKQLGAPT